MYENLWYRFTLYVAGSAVIGKWLKYGDGSRYLTSCGIYAANQTMFLAEFEVRK